MTYIQAVTEFRTIRADLDRINRLIKSPRISAHTKTLLKQEQVRIAVLVAQARSTAITLGKLNPPTRKTTDTVNLSDSLGRKRA